MPKGWPAILTLGWILLAVAASEAGIALFSLAAKDGLATLFAANAAVTAGVGGACILTTAGRPFELRFRDATILTVLAWFAVPIFIALPLITGPTRLSFADAYFESVSGLTTTGATVLTGLDRCPPRSFCGAPSVNGSAAWASSASPSSSCRSSRSAACSCSGSSSATAPTRRSRGCVPSLPRWPRSMLD